MTTVNTSSMAIRIYFNQIIHHIRNYDNTRNKLLQINNEIKDFSLYRDPANNSIFNLATDEGNNILLECCIHQIKQLCLQVVKKYGVLFDLGHYNNDGETALIYSIKHDWFYFAAFLIGYCEENPFKSIKDLNIENFDEQGKNALDYLFEKDKEIQVDRTVFQLEANGQYKQMLLLVELLGYYLDKSPDSTLTHDYINLICLDLPFYKPILEPYFKDHPDIKFTNQFCKAPVEASINLFQEGIPASRDLRSMVNTQVEARISNPTIALPDTSQNWDENDSDDERISLNPKNMSLPTPLSEYNPNNPGQIITYPRPFITSSTNSPRQEKRSLEDEEEEEEEQPNKKQRKVNSSSSFSQELGGNRRKKSNKKSTKKQYKKSAKKNHNKKQSKKLVKKHRKKY
uniref:Uncharacterized protein n=1 Tax=viral metagenome TaxID=1070528 RepID=A0A6C0KQG6_9ZZZZ